MADGHASNYSLSNVRRGFTIVELLIVVVVIAILAAITIVAYNGIAQRSKVSAAQSSTTQAAKKVLSYATLNSDQYPPDLTTVGIANSADTTYQYSVDNNASPRTFCVTATTSNISYYLSNGGANPTAGACAGHGVNGVAAVINYVKRPTPPGGDTTGYTGYNAAGGHTASPVINAWNGKYAFRYTAGAAGFSTNLTIGYEYQGTGIAVSANTTIYPSIHVRSNKAGNYRLNLSFFNGTTGVASPAVISTVAVPLNTWVRLVADQEVVVPSPADRMSIRAQYVSGTTWATNDWIDVTGVSTAPGAYADGDSPNWVWTGTAGYSTSTGPQL